MAAFDASSEPTTRRVPRGGLLSALTLRVPRRAPETPPAATPDDATLRVGERAAQVPALAPDGAPMLPLGSLQSGALICEDCTVRAGDGHERRAVVGVRALSASKPVWRGDSLVCFERGQTGL